MSYLEALDAADRIDGTARLQRLRQVPRGDTGQFLAILAAEAPDGSALEIGTSAGYSALWLALVCAPFIAPLVTFEILPKNAQLVRETFLSTGVASNVHLVEGDA